MFRQLTASLRAFRRDRIFVLLNIAGLALGAAACIIAGLYVSYELSTDRFHEHTDRIVQLGVDRADGPSLRASYLLADELEKFPALIEQTVRADVDDNVEIEREAGGSTSTIRVMYTEPAFFDVFSFEVIHGNGREALAAPNGIVLTEDLALGLFGETNVVGQTVNLSARNLGVPGGPRETRPLTVQAVVANPPQQSTIQFDALAPMSAVPGIQVMQVEQRGFPRGSFLTYAFLQRGASAREVEETLQPVFAERQADADEAVTPLVTPLASVYLSEAYQADGFQGQLRYLYAFGLSGLFILLIAGINYVNLATAWSFRRSREIGVRKSVGAGRKEIALSFLYESLLLCVVAVLFGMLLAAALLPHFVTAIGAELEFFGQPGTLVLLVLFVLAVGIAAASYPAFVLARLDPVRVLRDRSATASGSAGYLRRGLMFAQFAVCALLLIGTWVMFSQLRYVSTTDLGFNPERLVVFQLDDHLAWQARDVVRTAAQNLPGIERASVSSNAPSWNPGGMGGPRSAFSPQAVRDPDEQMWISTFLIDGAFFDTYGMRLVAGRDFDPDRPGDTRTSMIINETAARTMGWTPEEAIGKPFNYGVAVLGLGLPHEVIGVIADFHATSMRDEIPAISFVHTDGASRGGGQSVITVRLEEGASPMIVEELQAAIEGFTPSGEKERFAFMEDRFSAFYQVERRLARLVGIFALVAIGVACMGIFGLASIMIARRRKEIAVRRVLGARVTDIVRRLSREYVIMAIAAVLITAPPAHWLMNRWLEGFVYRTSIGWLVFIVTGLLLATFAILIVAYHSNRASAASPADVLRTD